MLYLICKELNKKKAELKMEQEIRVYVANGDTWYQNLDPESDIVDVMDCAESQGTVMTLPTFIKMFNNGELDLTGGNTVIRMAIFEGVTFVREVI